MRDVYTEKCTIYNRIPANGDAPARFSRCVLERCSIQGGFRDRSKDSVRVMANADTVYTKDVQHYKKPVEFYSLSDTTGFYTAATDDVLVFGVVNDAVNTPAEFSKLKTDYKGQSIVITKAWARLALPAVAHIEITNV